MSKTFFYPRMAFTNIRKNGRFYIPFILTSIGTVAMFYVMNAIAVNPGLDNVPSSASVSSLLTLGTFVIGLFSIIFIFYTNSFLMKRRKKELGLYNILGMGKGNLAKMMLWETGIIAVIALVGGIGIGVLFSKLFYMLLAFLLNFAEIGFVFEFSTEAAIITLVLFAIIFMLNLLYNLAKIKLSKPIELLHGTSMGEKVPKTRHIIAILGFLCVGGGYVIALTVESALAALDLFFIAVVLVIIGTYLLFVAGSVAVLRMMKSNKKYYYNSKHFTSVSGMIFRMKQNGVGLANICILSTMVLVMISTTVSMYVGVDEELLLRYPHDFKVNVTEDPDRPISIEDNINESLAVIEKNNLKVDAMSNYKFLDVMFIREENSFVPTKEDYFTYGKACTFEFITAAEYEKLTGDALELKKDECAVYTTEDELDQFELLGKSFKNVNPLEVTPYVSDYIADLMKVYIVVVDSEDTFMELYKLQREERGIDSSYISHEICFDITGEKTNIENCDKELRKIAAEKGTFPVEYTDENGNTSSATILVSKIDCRETAKSGFYGMYGCFLFLGLFLGALFIMATVLIIYYKQMSEGYEDRERFQMMKKVGMSNAEVKKSIRSQVLTVFFLPIIVATLHVCGSLKMISKLLMLLNLTNIWLFIICTFITVAVFAVVYGFVYLMTARTYYKIINGK